MIAAPLRLPVAVSIVIALASAAWIAWSSAEATRKMEAVDTGASGNSVVNVVITLNFAPEAFHMNGAQQIGQVVKTDGPRLYLRSADRSLLRNYARAPWVKRVDPWSGE